MVEVLSPSTSSIDRFRKHDEYRRHPTLRWILLVQARFPSEVLAIAWKAAAFDAMTDRIDLSAIGAALALSDIYEDMVFEWIPEPQR